MIQRVPALVLACATAVLALPAAAQLRPSPQLAPSRADTGPRAADYIVAVVNAEPITNSEVRTRLLRFEQQLAQQGAAMPPRAELARVVLERLISEKAQLQLAADNGIRIDDAQVDQAEENFARQYDMDVRQLRRQMQLEGTSPATFREDLRSQLTLSRLRGREVEAKVRVSEADIDQYIREQQGAANDPSNLELNLGHILVVVPENASEQQVRELQARAEGIAQRARQGEDFTGLAKQFSQAPGAAQSGGQMGLRPADRYPPLFIEATQSTAVGGIAGPVRSGAGFHVLKVLSKSQSGESANTVTQTKVRHILLRVDDKRSTAQAAKELAEFKKRIEAGTATFAGLARDNSQDGSAKDGGELGWSRPGMFVPEFEEAMDRLQPGQVSDPVVSRFGVHLIQVEQRREAKLSQAEQRDAARSVLREKRMEEAYNTWVQEVRGRAYVEYREPPQS